MIPTTIPISAICAPSASAPSHADTARQAQMFAELMMADPTLAGMSNLVLQPLTLNQVQAGSHLKLDDEE